MLAYLLRKFLAATEALLPDAPDDTMALAEAAGVAVQPVDYQLLAAHQAVCRHTERMAAARQSRVGQSDFAVWTHEMIGRLS